MKKRIMTLIALLTLDVASMTAQEGLHVAEIFSQFGHEKGCKMVEMHDAKLSGYKLATYISLTYTMHAKDIDQLLQQDRQTAKKIREVVNDGRIVSGYYILSPTANGLNRYILYTNRKDNSGAVIYIEGKLEADDILKMCYQK